jgi:hypothetical protein
LHKLACPAFDGFPQFPKAAFEEVVGAFDHDQLFRIRNTINKVLEFGSWPKLVASAADKEFGFRASAKEIVLIAAIVNGRDRRSQCD